MSKRIKANYPGVFYREGNRIGQKGTEKIYYVLFKRDGKVYEEKAAALGITSIRSMKYAIGYEAAEILYRMATDPKESSYTRRVIMPELIIRSSCGEAVDAE